MGPLANKSVLVIGHDGFACLSYSGAAHIDSQPTDDWLAELVSGSPKILGPSGGGAMEFSPGFMPNLGLALQRVASAVEHVFPQQPMRRAKAGLDVLAAGFVVRRVRSPRPRIRPFLTVYRYDGHAGTFSVSSLPRYWDWARRSSLGQVGVYAPETARILKALAAPGTRDQDDAESLLVDCVRTVSGRDNTVGADCVSVVISPYGKPRVRFLPDPQADQGKVAYTPWVVGPGAVIPPQVFWGAGSNQFVLGGLDVEFDRIPPLTQSGARGAYGQPRRPLR